MNELGTDATFFVLLGTVGYCAVSSLLGVDPNKIPLISKAVMDRMPSIDNFLVDKDGKISFKEDEEQEKKQKEDKDEKND